jgi:Asp-tRNA(Asn)/Glu-tRNA(Gln) amidotransferase A subunit family amidase
MLYELADAVRNRKVSPRELVEDSLRRIDDAQDLNAVIARRDDAALAEADTLSDDRRNGPLAGIPLLVKDLSNVAGMRTTFGSPLYAYAPAADTDSTIVERLRAAGAVVVGKTNTPAFGWTGYTDNQVFGATRNPWNLDRSPGGSSGGSGAALAAGLAPLATTTDGGGSVRIPASLSGLVGYKPTLGVIARDFAPNWLTFSTSGATSATVADVVLEGSVLAGPNRRDLNELPSRSVPIEAVRPSRVIACRTLRADVDPSVEAAFDTTLGVIENDLGIAVTVVDTVFDDPELPLDWFTVGSAEFAQSFAWCEDRWDEFEPGLTMLLRVGASVTTTDYLAKQRKRYQVAAVLEELLGDDAVLLTPTLNVTSWPPDGPLPQEAGSVTNDPAIAVNTVEFNFTGQPAVSVPMGTGPEGVPIGLQVVAPRFGDRFALGLAAALEQAQPWALTASGYEAFDAAFGAAG